MQNDFEQKQIVVTIIPSSKDEYNGNKKGLTLCPMSFNLPFELLQGFARLSNYSYFDIYSFANEHNLLDESPIVSIKSLRR
jgi:hypothetical protein